MPSPDLSSAASKCLNECRAHAPATAVRQILSRWGSFSWKAEQVNADRACFVPVSAPSSFCWIRRGSDKVEVVQRWKDDAGVAQSYTIILERVAPP